MNWHVVVGLGTIVAAYEADLPVMLDCQVRAMDRSGKRLRIETSKGAIAADQAIVAVPTTLLRHGTCEMTTLAHYLLDFGQADYYRVRSTP